MGNATVRISPTSIFLAISYIHVTVPNILSFISWHAYKFSAKPVPKKERKGMDERESESRSRVRNIHPWGLRLGHSTTGHAHSLHLHGPHRPHSTDRPNHQLSVCHVALGRPSQRQTTSMCRSDGPPTISHEPTPASFCLRTQVLRLHRIQARNCCPYGNPLRGARRVDRVPPRIAPAGACDEGRAAEARHCECIILVLCLAVPVIVRTSSHGLSAARVKDGGSVAESITTRNGSCGRLTWRRAGGREGGNVRAQMF
jgi:hypothetical protein